MWTINENKNWERLRKYSWVNDMHGVPQSPVHHAEGDVAIHTQMVLQQLVQLSEYNALDAEAKEILWASALMHDIEKRSTTVTDEYGNITSPSHARKGAMTVRQILYREIPTPFTIREQISGLVKHHGLPLWIFEKGNTVNALLKASLEVNTEWLYMLAKADALGRICQDQADLLYRLDMFRVLCEEHDCWGKSRHFATDLARFHYFQSGGPDPAYVPYNNMLTEVVILSGLPGSGKDHYLHQHYRHLPVISLDDMRRRLKIDRKDTKGNGRIIQAAMEQAREYLRNLQSFAWNATNITRSMREQLINVFEVYDPRITLVYVEVPYHKLVAQNRSREYSIPQAAIEKLIDKLDIPKLWEAHELKYVTGKG